MRTLAGIEGEARLKAHARGQQAKIIAGLESKGFREVDHTTKYRIYRKGEGTLFYVGKAGALRAGRTVRDSMPVPDRIKKGVLACGERELQKGETA